MEYINRHLEDKVISLSKSYSAILVTGPRQSGKTTMLRKLAERENHGREYVSLDDFTVREMAKNDPALFLQLHKPPVLIDEVQFAPALFTYIKIHIDKYHNPGDFWMTGSQIFRLMQGVQESLAGRVALLHMSPLSAREITGRHPRPFTTDFEALLAESKSIPPVSTPEIFKKLWRGSMPGIVSGLLLAFTLSLDDFVISFFTTGSGVTNLSITVYNMARRGVSPEINAVSALMFLVVLILLFFINRPKKSRRRQSIQE